MKGFMAELAELMNKHDIVVIDSEGDHPIHMQGPNLEVWEFTEGVDKSTLYNTVIDAPETSWSRPGKLQHEAQ
jgi:hypothetical protein